MEESQSKSEPRDLSISAHNHDIKKEDLLPFYLFAGILFFVVSAVTNDSSIIAAGLILFGAVFRYKILKIQHQELAVKENLFKYLRHLKRPSVIALILSNSIPLIGVFFWQWNLFNIVLIYWLETGVMGFYNIFKIRMAKLADEKPITISSAVKPYRSGIHRELNFEDSDWGKEAVLPTKYYPLVFMAKLLFLMAANGILVYFIFYFVPLFHQFGFTQKNFESPAIIPFPDLMFSMILLFISHGVSFFYNYVWRKEYLYTSPSRQMAIYDERFFIIHITILLGALFIEALGSYTILLAIMIILKIKFDLDLHIKKHPSFQTVNL